MRTFIVVTSPEVAGKRIVRSLGLVRGNTIRARHLGKDILAGLRNLVGGEIHEYAKLLAESRVALPIVVGLGGDDRRYASARVVDLGDVAAVGVDRIGHRFGGVLEPSIP